MGALAAYSLYTGIFLLAGYLLYKLVMSGEKQMTLNRAVLWTIYAVAFAAYPLSTLHFRNGTAAPAAAVDFGLTPLAAAPAASSQLPGILVAIYLSGVVIALLAVIVTAVRLTSLVRTGHRQEHDGYTLVLLPAGKVAPFSWGHYVVMGEDDYAAAGSVITAHELAHIRHRHCADLLFAQAACILLWYNPAAWLMREELKTVHEYQADASVLDSGIEPRTYQMLLIKKAVGTRFQSLANSLNHSKLKKRITMMCKEKNSGLRRLRSIVLAMAPVVAVAVVNIPAVANAMASLRAAEMPVEKSEPEAPAQVTKAVSERKDSEKTGSAIFSQASFPGGFEALMNFLVNNVKYPEAAKAAGHEGKAVVKFTVHADGSLSDFNILKSSSWEELDKEALRVARSMPLWEPAVNESGEAVDMEFALPVNFKLSGSEKKTETADGNQTTKDEGAEAAENADSQVSFKIIATDNRPAPDITIDGKAATAADVQALDNNEIESVSVVKNNPDHPNGLIVIELKK